MASEMISCAKCYKDDTDTCDVIKTMLLFQDSNSCDRKQGRGLQYLGITFQSPFSKTTILSRMASLFALQKPIWQVKLSIARNLTTFLRDP